MNPHESESDIEMFDAMLDAPLPSIDYDALLFDFMMNRRIDDFHCVVFHDRLLEEQRLDQLVDGTLEQDDHELISEMEIQEHQKGYGVPNSNIEIEFKIIEEGPWKKFPQFHSQTKLLRAKIVSKNDTMIDISKVNTAIDNAYELFVQSLIHEAADNDRVFITFSNPAENRELYINFTKKNFCKDEFLSRAYKLAQSAGNFLDGGILEIKIQIIKSITGHGSTKVSRLIPGSIRSAAKKSVIEIRNNDYKCGYLAIALGKYLADCKAENTKPNRNVKYSSPAQQKIAAVLFQELGFPCESPVDMQMISQIQTSLTEYQIIVVDRKTQLKLFSGEEKSRKIILEYSDPPHYNIITRLTGYLDCDDFCDRCWIKINRSRNHVCKNGCPKCSSINVCAPEDEEKACSDCHLSFLSEQCFTNHIQNNTCLKRKKCDVCWVIYNDNQKHQCDFHQCQACGVSYRSSPHYCFIKPLNKVQLAESDSKHSFLICYDIESMQTPCSESESIHEPNLLMSQTLCTNCTDTMNCRKNCDECDTCGPLEHIWLGTDCVEKFCDYLYNEIAPAATKAKAKVTIVAHNQRGYDGHFLIQDFFNRDFQATPNLVMSGSKILCSQIENLKFIDSLSLFMQPLSALCKSFNITEMKKGFFPHFFNTPENQDYVGPIPPLHDYKPTAMKPEQQHEFMKWYLEQIRKSSIFDFKKEIIEYCRSDVSILMTSMLKFINLFSAITGLNPIVRSFTLASVAMETFRSTMLPKNTLGITPIGGYATRMQSGVAASWLDSLQKQRNTKIHREWRLGPFFADGFIPESSEVFEFWGCYFHGCPECYPDRSLMVKMNGEEYSVESLYAKVQLKKSYYQHRGFPLTEIWEHELDRKEKYIAERLSYYQSLKHIGPINIRESFFGGRTNNIKFYHNCSSNERIRYLDFTSLYPFVLKKYTYPMKHPTLIQEDFNSIDEYFGFIKCKVVAPSKLNIAVLPVRIGKKLLFPLCRECAHSMNPLTCSHTEEERSFTNTWTSIELQEAVRVGYKIIKIYQVLDYEKSTSTSIFADYIQMWLKVKQEASGWPSWVKTEDDKIKYVRDYSTAENIELDPLSIEKNPGKRSIAKLMLNSFWGKLAQGNNLPQTTFLRSYADLWGLLNDETKEVMGVHEVSDTTILTQSRFKEECIEMSNPGKTNIAVASFVTAYARLELFRLIERIESVREGRVLYFDTDSVVFIEQDGDPEIKCGDYLGELTDEIPEGHICDTFVSLGPKNYGYDIVNVETRQRRGILKVKGIKLTSSALDLISVQQMTSMAEAYIAGQQEILMIPQSNIVSNKFTHIVKTKTFKKIYRAVSEKRRVLGNFTRPYGYIDE